MSARGARLLALALLAVVIVACAMRSATASPGGVAVASAYSRADSPGVEGCTGRPLSDYRLNVATYLVPCGARLEVCYRGRCVTVTRTDSGPHVAGRQIDLQFGVVRALGFSSPSAWGVRTVTWRRR